jgi:hypothetical protein
LLNACNGSVQFSLLVDLSPIGILIDNYVLLSQCLVLYIVSAGSRCWPFEKDSQLEDTDRVDGIHPMALTIILGLEKLSSILAEG